MMGRPGWEMAAAAVVAALCASGCAPKPKEFGPDARLLTPEKMGRWRLTPAYADAKPWTLTDDGVYYGHGSWVGYAELFQHFVLECEFLFDGEGQGGIVLRGDRDSDKPWESGYELDIDRAGDTGQGHIHFPVLPKPEPGGATFVAGVWHTVRVEAVGEQITVFLDGVQAIAFTDRQFILGHICLESEEGGVRYRNLRVRPIEQ